MHESREKWTMRSSCATLYEISSSFIITGHSKGGENMKDNQGNELKISVKLEAEDLEKYARFLYKRRLVSSSIAFFLASVVVTFYLIPSSNEDFSLQLKLIVIIIEATFSVGWYFVNRKIMDIRNKKVFETNKLLQKVHKYVLNSDGIYSEAESINGIVKWTDLFKINEDISSFYLFVSKIQAIIIPKRFLGDEEQIQLFKRIIIDNIEGNKIIFKR